MKIYKCGYCGYIGPCYGIPFCGGTGGVSAPFCPKCNINNQLTECTTDAPQENIEPKTQSTTSKSNH